MAAPSENKGVLLNGKIVNPVEYLQRTGQVKSGMSVATTLSCYGREYVLRDLVEEQGEEYW